MQVFPRALHGKGKKGMENRACSVASPGLFPSAPAPGKKVAFHLFLNFVIQYASKQASSTDDSVPPRFLSIKVYVVPKVFKRVVKSVFFKLFHLLGESGAAFKFRLRLRSKKAGSARLQARVADPVYYIRVGSAANTSPLCYKLFLTAPKHTIQITLLFCI